jgi:hypothetical protein
MTAEEDYRRDVAEIRRDSPAGPERDSRIARRWERFEADLFERDGHLVIVYRFQQLFAVAYLKTLKAFYLGEIDDAAFRRRRVRVLRRYAERLFDVGLIDRVWDDAWVSDFARDSLAFEREILPVPARRDTFGEAEAALLCDPLRDFSKRYFEAVHTRFGIGRIQRRPKLFGGVDSTLRDDEERYVVDQAAPSPGLGP